MKSTPGWETLVYKFVWLSLVLSIVGYFTRVLLIVLTGCLSWKFLQFQLDLLAGALTVGKKERISLIDYFKSVFKSHQFNFF